MRALFPFAAVAVPVGPSGSGAREAGFAVFEGATSVYSSKLFGAK